MFHRNEAEDEYQNIKYKIYQEIYPPVIRVLLLLLTTTTTTKYYVLLMTPCTMYVLYTVVVYNRNMKYLPADTVVGCAGDTTRDLYTATIVGARDVA